MGSEYDYRGWPFNYLTSGSNNWALNLITEPPVEPISIDEAKAHLRINFTDDDAYIAALIVSARLITEERTNRSFITQTWEYVLDNFPNSNIIKLRKPKLQSVSSIKYKDVSNTEYTMDTSDYIVDTDSIPGRIILNWGKFWPVILLQPGSAVRIRFVAGYAPVIGQAITTPETLGTGDGTQKTFTAKVIPIKPGSETVFFNGVATSLYTINYTTGAIVCTAGVGAPVTMTYTKDTDYVANVPKALKQAMFYLISNWYEQREPVILSRSQLLPVPLTFDSLVGPYRVVTFQ